jgi:hypothetical protein
LLNRGLRHAVTNRKHPIEQIVLKSAGLTRQPTDAQIDDMAAAAANVMKPLLTIAMSGNVRAILKVTELASNLCAETTTLACMHQRAANIVARERTTWPLNISPDPKERRRTLRLVNGPRRLPLGNPPKHSSAAKQPGGFSSPATSAVLVALKAIEIERSFRIPSELFPPLQPKWSEAAARLPDLQPATADAWFNVLWLYICDRHRGAPEKSKLRRLVESTESPPTSAAEPNVRAAIRKVLERAFLRLASGRAHRG